MPETAQFYAHPREYADFKFAYPVVSRRSRGLSIGVNLNPDKVCNWDCPYCQVDRVTPPEIRTVNEDELFEELKAISLDAISGVLWEQPRFATTPEYLRRIRDFALAGDGEPTSYQRFGEVVTRLTALKAELGLAAVRTNLLTNASLFHLPYVQRGLVALDETPSEVWCKIDAGTEEYFQRVNKSKFRLRHCLDNIEWLALRRPLTIQSMFFKLDGEGPGFAEIAAYIENLYNVVDSGGKVKMVQVYTIARAPGESNCTPLEDREVDDLVSSIRFALPDLDVQGYYGKHSNA